MLKHLDDPHHPELPPDFRDRVRRRGQSLRRRRRLAGGAALTLLMLLGVGTGLYARAFDRVDQVERLTVAGTGDPVDVGDRTVLVVGVDLGLDRPLDTGPSRTDTILIVRLHDDRASVLSVPRDLAVESPGGNDGLARINTVAATQGYSGLVEVIGGEFGIDIDNFIMLDMDGFSALVDLVGGVDVHFTQPTRDQQTGLRIDAAGCHRLDGDQALALALSRTLESLQDGHWRTDPSGDLGRIDRQSALLTSGLQALARTRSDPITADRLAGWLVDHTAVDDTLGTGELISLVRTVMTVGPNDLSFTTVAVEDHVLPGGAVVLLASEPAEQTVTRWNSSHGRTNGPDSTPPGGDETSVSLCHSAG